ncbi:MAG: dihydroorotate dehydrogenase [Oscillospiraceae bacterium]|nr:dihydroorotate dehydrogenase [Oscillospiraceae bacterium]
MVNTSVTLCGIRLKNPVMPASGVYGFGTEFLDFYDPNLLGAVVLKGSTLNPRYGNPLPRIAECTSGMINSVGLQNPGIDAVLEKELPTLRSLYHGPVIANISGFSLDEFAVCCEKMDGKADILEVNVSCPNVHGGGMSFGATASAAASVIRAVRCRVKKSPVFVKLSPNVLDIAEIACACEAEGADGLTLINTLLGMRIDLRTRRPVIANKMGGFSGPAILPVALRMVYQCRKAVKIPIIGVGGVSCAEDVLEMMMVGASAIQVGAENLRDPYACKRIIDELPETMKRYGIESISDIVGVTD